MSKFIALAAAAAFAAVTHVSAFADSGPDLSKLSAVEISAMKERVTIAHGLIAIGRKDGDAQLVAVGARILSDIKVDVIDPTTKKDGGKGTAYNAKAILESLSGMKDGKAAMMSVQLSPDYTKPANYCYWDYECGTFECGWVYRCDG